MLSRISPVIKKSILASFLVLAAIPATSISERSLAQEEGSASLDRGAKGPRPSTRPLIPLDQRDIKPIAKAFTLTGEVVDTWCYASQVMGSGRGEAHKSCALACGHGGVTLGIVDDQGTLYVAVKSRAYNGANQMLLPFIAKRVKATGWLATKGGSNIMKIQTVELAK